MSYTVADRQMPSTGTVVLKEYTDVMLCDSDLALAVLHRTESTWQLYASCVDKPHQAG